MGSPRTRASLASFETTCLQPGGGPKLRTSHAASKRLLKQSPSWALKALHARLCAVSGLANPPCFVDLLNTGASSRASGNNTSLARNQKLWPEWEQGYPSPHESIQVSPWFKLEKDCTPRFCVSSSSSTALPQPRLKAYGIQHRTTRAAEQPTKVYDRTAPSFSWPPPTEIMGVKPV